MPKGVYPRTDKQKEISRRLGLSRKGISPYIHTEKINKKISNSLLGNVPHNKGIQREDILYKVKRYKLGLENECKKHGFHSKWCLHSENNVKCKLCTHDRQKESAKKDPVKFIYRDAKQHAKKGKRIFNVSLDYLYNLINHQGNQCALTGKKFSDHLKPSLDRIDSLKGYEEGNLQFVLIDINKMKTNLDQNRFIELCTLVHEAGLSKEKIGNIYENMYVCLYVSDRNN